MKTYRITATIQKGIRDNQGTAVQKMLVDGLGFTTVNTVRIGKIYMLTVEDGVDIDAVAKGLINEVMENYTIEELKSDPPSMNDWPTLYEKIRRIFMIPRSLLKK